MLFGPGDQGEDTAVSTGAYILQWKQIKLKPKKKKTLTNVTGGYQHSSKGQEEET